VTHNRANRKFNINIRLIGVSLFLVFSLVPLSPALAEEEAQEEELLYDQFQSEYVMAFLNNQYLRENIRLIALAEERYNQNRYDDAMEYAREAMRYAQLSDEYVSLHLRIRETNYAISSARFRLDWARRMGAPSRYKALYERAQDTFADALEAHESEAWDSARGLALQVIDILSGVSTVLPAQFLVRTWEGTRDCLWNIAALPEIYGDGSRWPVLYQANRDRMPRPGNPHLIRPGMVLDIPSIAGEVRYGMMEN